MAEEKLCPKCGKPLLKRKNKTTGDEFYGCSGYPECRYTEKLDQKFVTCPKCGKQAKVIKYPDKKTGKPRTAHICEFCGYKN